MILVYIPPRAASILFSLYCLALICFHEIRLVLSNFDRDLYQSMLNRCSSNTASYKVHVTIIIRYPCLAHIFYGLILIICILPQYSDSVPQTIAYFRCIINDIDFAGAEIVPQM